MDLPLKCFSSWTQLLTRTLQASLMSSRFIGLKACCFCITESFFLRECISSQKSAFPKKTNRYGIFFLEEFIWSQGQPSGTLDLHRITVTLSKQALSLPRSECAFIRDPSAHCECAFSCADVPRATDHQCDGGQPASQRGQLVPAGQEAVQEPHCDSVQVSWWVFCRHSWVLLGRWGVPRFSI